MNQPRINSILSDQPCLQAPPGLYAKCQPGEDPPQQVADPFGAASNESPFAERRDRDQIFTHLVKEQWVRLRRFVVKRIGDGPDADDILQQAFTEAVSSYAKFDHRSTLSTWLYGIALNLIRNHLSRSPGRRYEFVAEGTLDEVYSEEYGPATRYLLNETVGALHRELERLPTEMRNVVKLITFEDASYEEVADRLAIPVGTVRSRLFRAREILRKRLTEANYEIQRFA